MHRSFRLMGCKVGEQIVTSRQLSSKSSHRGGELDQHDV
jgi:hypothetical protein